MQNRAEDGHTGKTDELRKKNFDFRWTFHFSPPKEVFVILFFHIIHYAFFCKKEKSDKKV
jgi:hypothetical protein